MNPTIRKAGPSDLEWLLVQLRDFAAFYNTKKSLFPKGDEHGRLMVDALIAEHVVLIAEKDSVPIGFIAGVFLKHPFNPEIRTLSEQFFWVTAAHRGGRAAVMLLNGFVALGELKADWILFTIEHGGPMNDRALLSRGFRLKEINYLKEVG